MGEKGYINMRKIDDIHSPTWDSSGEKSSSEKEGSLDTFTSSSIGKVSNIPDTSCRRSFCRPPLVKIIRPSLSSPTGFGMDNEPFMLHDRDWGQISESDVAVSDKETDILLPEKRENTLEELNKRFGTQSAIELLSFPGDTRSPAAASFLWDNAGSKPFLRRQDPVCTPSPATSAECLTNQHSSLAPPSEGVSERTCLLSASTVPLICRQRASVDISPSNIRSKLADYSNQRLVSASSSRFSPRSRMRASVKSTGHVTETRRSLDNTFDRYGTPGSLKRRPSTKTGGLMYRGYSAASEPPNRPGEVHSYSPDSRISRESGLNDMVGKLSVPSLVAPQLASVNAACRGSITQLNQLAGNQSQEKEKNPLYQVSSDMLRISGYTSQFRNLLSSRNNSITGADTPTSTLVPTSQSPETPAASEKQNGRVVRYNGLPSVDKEEKRKQSQVIRQETRYGISISSDSTVKQRMKIRKKLYYQRGKLCDYSVSFALIGVALAVIEGEITAASFAGVDKGHFASTLLKVLIMLTTLVLLVLVVSYHSIEIKLAVIDSGADDWRVAITWGVIGQIAVELLICGICPVPGTGTFFWPYLQRYDARSIEMVEVPVDVVLSLPMFIRSYLLARFMVMHSKQFQDAATRSIAALNRVGVDFKFVVKTMMVENPLVVLIIFTLCYWICVAWMLTQCDRYGMPDVEPGMARHNYLNSLWLIIVTFMSIGYGDVVPNTYCGRTVAIATGIVGAGVSSALIAVISRKLELSKAEKHVNNFMADSKLQRQRKDAAAAVLQQTWFIHKYKTLSTNRDDLKVRAHQRKFLQAIYNFRRIKWDQRKLAEQGHDLIDVGKVQSELHESIWDMQKTQEHLISQIDLLTQKILQMQQFMVAQYDELHRIQEQMQAHVTANFRPKPNNPVTKI